MRARGRAASYLRFSAIFGAVGLQGHVRALLFGVVASDATNNLPAALAAASAIHDRTQIWPLLIGTNIGPVLVITGVLSGLLSARHGRTVGGRGSARRYAPIGLRVGLPALLVASLVVLVV